MPDPTPTTVPPRPPWWHWINWLALDAVAVALVWLQVFAVMTGARLTPVISWVLAAAVWLVYMMDRRAVWLLPLMIAVTAAAGWAALYQMRWITVQAGGWLAAAVAAYFVMVAASRWQSVSQGLLLLVSSLMLLGLAQGEQGGPPGVQLWRAIAAGTLLTVLYFGLRHHYQPPPWTLVKKVIGGYLFAVGVALAPFSHLQDWPGLLGSAPVLLFAGACALNSLGIRLWENHASGDAENQLLRRLYPWLLATVILGSLSQAFMADAWTRPGLTGIAACTAGFGLLHVLRHRQLRWPALAYSLAADGLMLVCGLLAWYAGSRITA